MPNDMRCTCILQWRDVELCPTVLVPMHFRLKCRAGLFKSTLHHALACHEGLRGHAVLTPGEPCDGVHWLASVHAGQPCIIAGLEFVAHIAGVHLDCGMRMILILTRVMMQMALCDE